MYINYSLIFLIFFNLMFLSASANALNITDSEVCPFDESADPFIFPSSGPNEQLLIDSASITEDQKSTIEGLTGKNITQSEFIQSVYPEIWANLSDEERIAFGSGPMDWAHPDSPFHFHQPIIAASIGILLPVSLFFGYRRIVGKTCLEHPVRRKIFEFIHSNPGVQIMNLSRDLNLKRSTLLYHIQILRLSNKIKVYQVDGRSGYYENNNRYPGWQKNAYFHFRDPVKKRILLEIMNNRMATRRELSESLRISGPAISWHVRRMMRDGLIDTEREGRTIRYRATAGMEEFLRENLQ